MTRCKDAPSKAPTSNVIHVNFNPSGPDELRALEARAYREALRRIRAALEPGYVDPRAVAACIVSQLDRVDAEE